MSTEIRERAGEGKEAPAADTPAAEPLKAKDFASDQDVRWCPGCGDYAILKAVQSVFPELGIPKEEFVVVSGIGCSSRFPYYMDTYGFHSIHGRAPALATGLKVARPELEVWVVTGDGDAMSIGGNHFVHILRRNVGVKVLMFNNRIYGLTKGQYSPTSEVGKKTKSTPLGSIDNPFNPLALALGAGATFVARAVDIFVPHLKEVLRRAAAHKGTAFVEIYQNCNIFNDGAFSYMTGKEERQQRVLYLEHGKPLVYGKESDEGLRLRGVDFESVHLGDGVSAEDCHIWDEHAASPGTAFALAQAGMHDEASIMPTPIGVFREVERPTYEDGVHAQVELAKGMQGEGDLNDLIYGGDTWTVEA